MGALDVDGDGADEVLVRTIEHVLHGGSVPDMTLFKVRSGEIIQVRDSDGALSFPVGGVSNYGNGMRCPDVDDDGRRELVLLRVENAVSEKPRWTRSTYELVAGRVRLRKKTAGHMRRDGFPDPEVQAFYELRCDGLKLD